MNEKILDIKNNSDLYLNLLNELAQHNGNYGCYTERDFTLRFIDFQISNRRQLRLRRTGNITPDLLCKLTSRMV